MILDVRWVAFLPPTKDCSWEYIISKWELGMVLRNLLKRDRLCGKDTIFLKVRELQCLEVHNIFQFATCPYFTCQEQLG